jgi:hypothetical protein
VRQRLYDLFRDDNMGDLLRSIPSNLPGGYILPRILASGLLAIGGTIPTLFRSDATNGMYWVSPRWFTERRSYSMEG